MKTSIDLKRAVSAAGSIAALASTLSVAAAEVAPAPGEVLLAIVHAEGAQVYVCGTDAAGALGWQFREPIATLIDGVKTVGRHYAGPTWEFADGTMVTGKVAVRADGRSPQDIPHLKLDAKADGATAMLAGVATVLRVNTRGGIPETPCTIRGTLASAPYSADYKFYGAASDEQLGILHGPYDYLFGSEYPVPAPSPRPAL